MNYLLGTGVVRHIKVLVVGAVLMLLPFISSADEYYVSPDASAAWPLCSDISQPCSATTAMVNAVAGDFVYFRGGTYNLYYDQSIAPEYYWYRGILNPTNSGAPDNPITFMAYPNETPVMNAHTDSRFTDIARAFGTGTAEYIVYDGFVIMADSGVRMGGMILTGHNLGRRALGLVVKNMVMNGGSTVITSTDNRDGLRIEMTSHALVQNSMLFNYRQVSNWPNTAAMKMYSNDNLTIENMEIFNSTAAIYMKSDVDNSVVRNNFLHDNARAVLGYVYLDKSSDNNEVYNNVIVNNSMGGVGVTPEEAATADGWLIYNNTIHNSAAGISAATGKWSIWNNIIVANTTRSIWRYGQNILIKSDHNQYGDALNIITGGYTSNPSTYLSLSAWQASADLQGGGNPGQGSLSSDPMFANASGTLSELNDFRLLPASPSKGTGRLSADMGANIDAVGVGSNIIAAKLNGIGSFTVR